MSGVNPLAQSDEDFLNEGVAPEADPAETSQQPAIPDEEAHNAGDPPEDNDDDKAKEPDEGGEPSVVEDPDPTSGADEKDKSDGDDDPEPKTEGDDDEKASDPSDSDDGKPPVDDKAGATTGDDDKDKKADEKPVGDVRVFQVPTDFTANGKTVKLKDEAEALKLMQMGANYTRKMQELAPHRKVLMMLQNNGLLEEDRLSFLIDLDKKNPEAIRKLIKDSGIDPLEIDTEAEDNYFAGTHSVSEQEVGFRTVMEDISSDDAGKETISLINTNWDKESKEILWEQPEIMTVIHDQRQSGIYDQIKDEVDRQITLGKIPANTPFLAAYKQVGDQLVAEALKDDPTAGQQPSGSTEGSPGVAPLAPTPVVTRAAAPKPKVKNGDKAGAASTSRSSPGNAKTTVNPLAMADDQFLKDMEDRV